MKRNLFTIASAIMVMAATPLLRAVPITFDDFNVGEGHFNLLPTFSGQTVGLLTSSTADRVTTDGPREGAGHERLVLRTNGVTSAVAVRFLSGSGMPPNNTAFTTSSGPDGWIGCYVKTTNTGWNVQIYIEGAENNGGVPKDMIADGEWHLYEWDLDDETGGANGWGGTAGVASGDPDVQAGSYTIDSILFRNPAVESGTNILFLDFVARNDAGSVSNLLQAPCIGTSGVLVTGPLSTNSNQVLVTGVSASATNITVYQDSGAGMLPIGQKATGVTAGTNTVTITGLLKSARVGATQTINGQEGCVPQSSTGILVGGGANPRIRAAVSIRPTSDAGPVGAPATDLSIGDFHFLGSSATVTTSGTSGPAEGTVIYPSNNWQTITFLRGTNEVVGDSVNAAGVPAVGTGYNANDSVSLLVYAYKILPNGIKIFSAAAATSAEVSSNDVFKVNWTWSAVPNAQGYRILRSVNFGGYGESVDVAVNNYSDANVGWTAETTVTPTTAQPGRSVRWFPGLASTNALPGQWGVLDSLNFAIDDLTDTGPYDLYIDNLQNGSTVWQTFEESAVGASEVSFRRAGFSGTPSGNVLTTPDSSVVSNIAADDSSRSLRLRFQWAGTNATRWVRLSTSTTVGANPLVNLDDPISFRILLLPVGSSPVGPPQAISVAHLNGQTVLNWTGAHQLQAASLVTGTYTNLPGVTTAPWTNTFTEPQKFFRLAD